MRQEREHCGRKLSWPTNSCFRQSNPLGAEIKMYPSPNIQTHATQTHTPQSRDAHIYKERHVYWNNRPTHGHRHACENTPKQRYTCLKLTTYPGKYTQNSQVSLTHTRKPTDRLTQQRMLWTND